MDLYKICGKKCMQAVMIGVIMIFPLELARIMRFIPTEFKYNNVGIVF